MKKTLIGAAAALSLLAIGATPALATGNTPKTPNRCEITTVATPKPQDGVITESGGGKGTIKNGYVKLETPAGADEATKYDAQVRWTVNPQDFKLKDLKALSYWAYVVKDGDRGFAAPAARLVLDNGKTLVFEPYWNGTVEEGKWKLWNVATTGGAKIWVSPGPAEPGTRTFASSVAEFGNAKVTSINVGLGTWNEGAVGKFNKLSYKFTVPCTVVIPAEPTVTPPTCEKAGELVLPKTEGVEYTTEATDGGKVIVTAKAKSGYVIKSGAKTTWELTVLPKKTGKDCETQPTGSPTATPTATATATATAKPTTGAPTTSKSPVGAQLPVTGDSGGVNVPLVATLGGIVLIAAGAVILLGLRRRRDNEVNFTA